LANSLEYLHGQMNDLREFIEHGSRAGIILLVPLLRQNWTYSFKHVDEELKEPQYNYRDAEQKARGRQRYINAWRARKENKETEQ
jgi:hypothetical protein